jgi:hypothetical protein
LQRRWSCHRCRTRSSLPLDAIRRRGDTPIRLNRCLVFNKKRLPATVTVVNVIFQSGFVI